MLHEVRRTKLSQTRHRPRERNLTLTLKDDHLTPKRTSRFVPLLEDVTDVESVALEAATDIRGNFSVNDCADGIVALTSAHAILLSPERILVEQERHCVAALADAEQARLDALEVSDSCSPL